MKAYVNSKEVDSLKYTLCEVIEKVLQGSVREVDIVADDIKKQIENLLEKYYDKILNSKPVSEEQIEKLGEYKQDILDVLYEMDQIDEYPENESMNDKDTIRQSDFI